MINIKEALNLKTFKSFKLICGKEGLHNQISKIGILDYENEEEVRKNFYKDEFVLTNFLMGKEDKEVIKDIIKALIDINASGLAIKPIYIKSLPKEIIDYCNKNNFPIFFYEDAFFEDILNDFSEAKIRLEAKNNLFLNIKKLLDDSLKEDYVIEIVKNINKYFYDNFLILAVKPKDKCIRDLTIPIKWDISRSCKLIEFKDMYFFIYSYKDIKEDKKIYNYALRTIKLLGLNDKDNYIAFSLVHKDLESMNIALLEALNTLKICNDNNNILYFKDLGEEKFLLPLLENIWVEKYYYNIIEPLLEYDKKNNLTLIKTALIYYLNNRDFKKTAKLLYQHENTIRYRIKKIEEILNINDIDTRNIDMSIIFKIYKLKNLS